MTAPVWTVGQEVIVHGGYHRQAAVRTTVTKVGRKYIYVGRSDIKFDIATGVEVSDYSGKRQVSVPADYAEQERRTAVIENFRSNHGITLRHPSDYSTDGLIAALAVLDIDLERNTNG
jgi:hypothetical protein